MSVSAFAPEFTRDPLARPATRPVSPAFEQALYDARHPVKAAVRFTLRVVAYTSAAILALGGLPVALALFYDANALSVMFAL